MKNALNDLKISIEQKAKFSPLHAFSPCMFINARYDVDKELADT
jgi:hypothetical protein